MYLQICGNTKQLAELCSSILFFKSAMASNLGISNVSKASALQKLGPKSRIMQTISDIIFKELQFLSYSVQNIVKLLPISYNYQPIFYFIYIHNNREQVGIYCSPKSISFRAKQDLAQPLWPVILKPLDQLKLIVRLLDLGLKHYALSIILAIN